MRQFLFTDVENPVRTAGLGFVLRFMLYEKRCIMRLNYDFHLHSCLSPCGDMDMTPYNIANMAKILELDIIALTDHNTAGNCRAAIKAGEKAGVVVVPGMEMCTAEEIHVVCLFPDIEHAESFEEKVKAAMPPIKNKPDIFGRQVYMDEADSETGEEEILLITASGITISEVPELCREHGGFCYPAHINRSSFSILATLGMVTADMGFDCVEVTRDADLAQILKTNPDVADMRIMKSSDAHYLENMDMAAETINLPENSAAALINYLRGGKQDG